MPSRTPIARGTNSTPAAASCLRLTRMRGSLEAAILGSALRPIGEPKVSTCDQTCHRSGKIIRPAGPSMSNGICGPGSPDSSTRRSAASSSAMSAPELPAPTTRTSPSGSSRGLRYALECSCVTRASTLPANSGTRGSWNGPVAITTLAAS